ncbi:MAG TPA: prolyl oligopeptidase family serine peptidase [Gaiellaceae bacterium]|nr:prolyl oligopeptidase family serine peptidase [Gaiellaceae bacterium]
MADHSLANPPEARSSTAAAWRGRLSRAAAFARTETGVVRLALGAIALHVVDENYLQPQPGTSAADHLASGLVPVAILVGVAAAYPRLPAWLRAATAMTFGALGIAVGFPGAYYLLDGSAEGAHYTGLLAIAAGVILIGTGPVTLWKTRKRGGSRRRRWARRLLATVVGAVTALTILLLVVFPIAFSYGYTHIGRTAPADPIGVPHETVKVTTSDGLDLTATYVPSKNRAAIVVFPGASAVKEARMLVRNGYGVLLLDPRGQGGSEGDLVRWAGDRDLIAGAEYLQRRPDVDHDRIGGFGSSVGGEILLVAAAESDAFKAVVSEGAGFPLGDAEVPGAEGIVFAPLQVVMRSAATVFANHAPPPRIVDRIGRIAPRSVFLIYTEPGMGGEDVRQPKYFAAAGEPKSIWKVPGAEHTGGIDVRPAEYERRVVDFLDGALLGE